MSVPVHAPLHHYRGDSLGLDVTLWDDLAKTQPTSLTGATVLAQVRTNPDSDEVLGTFASTVTGNKISLTLAPAVTATLPDECAYDCQVTFSGGKVLTAVYGEMTVQPDTSRV